LGVRLDRLSPAAADDLRHPEYVLEMPQSGERIRGDGNVRAFRDAYHRAEPSRGAGDLWVVEAVRADDRGRLLVVAILELRDGRISRDTRWFAAPAWRARWVERFE
jgi:hypothetical protein